MTNQLGTYGSISAAQMPSNGCRRPRGRTVFHLPSTRSVLDDKRRPGVRQEVRRLRPDSPKVLASRLHGRALHVVHSCSSPAKAMLAASSSSPSDLDQRVHPAAQSGSVCVVESKVSVCSSWAQAASSLVSAPESMILMRASPIRTLRAGMAWHGHMPAFMHRASALLQHRPASSIPLQVSDRRLAFLCVCCASEETTTIFLDEVDTAGHDGRRGCMLGAAQATRRLDGTDGQVRGPIERTTVLMAIIHGHAGLGISRRCFGRGTLAGTVEAP